MPDISKIKLLDEITYDLRDSSAQPLLTFDTAPTKDSTNPVTSGGVYPHILWYGTCTTGASTQVKVVTISGITTLSEGLSLRIKFTAAQSYNGQPQLNLNNLGAVSIKRKGDTATGANAARYEWLANEVVDFVYDGSNWLIVNGGIATTTYYGYTKLNSSIDSTSTSVAATPSAVKTAYDLADSANTLATSVSNALPSKANQSQLAHVETGNSAELAYEAGDYFCWNSNLYIALTPISQGQSFVEGTNCEFVMVGQELMQRVVSVEFDSTTGTFYNTYNGNFQNSIVSLDSEPTSLSYKPVISGGIYSYYKTSFNLISTAVTISGDTTFSISDDYTNYAQIVLIGHAGGTSSSNWFVLTIPVISIGDSSSSPLKFYPIAANSQVGYIRFGQGGDTKKLRIYSHSFSSMQIDNVYAKR